MAFTDILRFLFTVIFIGAGTINGKSFVEVHCQAHTVGLYSQQTLLECVVQTSEEAKNPKIEIVTWRKGDDDPILYFYYGKLESLPGYGLAVPSWNDLTMNVSLLITKTTVKDEGVYECYVKTDSGHNKASTILNVTAKYDKPTIKPDPETINRNKEGTLTCSSTGGYPKGQLRWFDKDNKDWTKSSKMEVKETEGGLFSLSSTLSLLPGSIFSHYTCRVFNTRGDSEDEVTFTVPDEPVVGGRGQEPKESNYAINIVAPVLVIGSLIVGLLLLLLFKRRRSQSVNRAAHVCEQKVEEGDYRD